MVQPLETDPTRKLPLSHVIHRKALCDGKTHLVTDDGLSP